MSAKRSFDIVVSVAGLILVSPLLFAIALAVSVDSRGPVFFRQVRVGRHGVLFRIHKFRTMRVNQDVAAPQITIGRDPRITRVGAVLRRMKLDELPQLYDVARGTMSFVGPRPEVPSYVTHYPEDVKAIVFQVRPGITDSASLLYIDEADLLGQAEDPESLYIAEILPAKIAHHIRYVKERSMAGDLGIILATLMRILVPRGHRAA